MTLTVSAHHRQGQFTLDATFSAERGVTAIFGRSGSGKSTLLRIIGGLLRPEAGRVELDGAVLFDSTLSRDVPMHRRRFGHVFQEPRLFPHLSVRQNLAYSRWFARSGEPRANFDQIVSLLGLSALVDRRPAHLSGGEKQRVAIGRALLSSPRMLLMDEPLSALDEPRKAEILPYLERLRDEMDLPILYVSHSVPEVGRLADRVVMLRDGRIEAIGTPSDILGTASFETGREAGSIIAGRVARIDEETGLAVIATGPGKILVADSTLAIGHAVRLRIPAREVLLATVRPEGISALNILDGVIAGIEELRPGTMDVRVLCGGDVVHAHITQASMTRLALAEGRSVYAVIKTVALDQR
jgi:molybdate transport system ATP-binding protein